MWNGQALTLWLDSAVAFRSKEKVGSWILNSYTGQLIYALLRSIGMYRANKYRSWILWSKGFDLEAWLLQIDGSKSSWLTLWRQMANPLSLDLETELGLWESLSKIILLFFCWLFGLGRRRSKGKPTGNTRWSQNTRLVSPFGQLKTRFSGFSIFFLI